MSGVLYTPEVLGLATGLSAYPLTEDLPLRGEARSRSCGSTLVLGIALDAGGRVARVGQRSHACAIGQASAAIFAMAAPGRSIAELVATGEAVGRWLAGGDDLPDWPGIAAIAAARAYPARHGAVMLPWTAAMDLRSASC